MVRNSGAGNSLISDSSFILMFQGWPSTRPSQLRQTLKSAEVVGLPFTKELVECETVETCHLRLVFAEEDRRRGLFK